MKRLLSANWCRIICVLLCIATGIIVYQDATEWYFSEPLAFGALIASVLFSLVASINLVRLKKKRILRDWLYPIYGLLFSLILLFYTFAANPWYPMNSFSGRSASYAVLVITVFFTIGSSIARLILRLIKKRKMKALAAPKGNDVPEGSDDMN